jgi:beta-xylosidase
MMQAIRHRLLASLVTMALTMVLSGAVQGRAASPDERARETEAKMTDDERFSLIISLLGTTTLVQRDPRIPEDVKNLSAGYTPGIPRLGIPALQSSDASMGVTNPGYRSDDKGATAFPASIVVGASFNPQLAREGGVAIAREARIRGFNIQLAGGMNLMRDVRNGRNFEYYSEDPFHSAVLAAEAVNGIQSQQVISTLKHYTLNCNETNRHWLDAIIDPAAHRESDLLAFQIAIERAQPGAIMSGYNKVNGEYLGGNHHLLNEVLKGAWGYKGYVTLARQGEGHRPAEVGYRWYAKNDTKPMFPFGYGLSYTSFAYKDLKVSGGDTVTASFTVTNTGQREGADVPQLYLTDAAGDKRMRLLGEGDDLSRRLAAESVTLLKNEKNLLPLDRDIKKVAVIGPHAVSTMVGFPHYTYPAALNMLRIAGKLGKFPMPGLEPGAVPAEGFAAMNAELAGANADVEEYVKASYPAVSLTEAVRRLLPNAEVTAVAGTGVVPSQPTDILAAVAAAKQADVVVLYVGGKAGWYGNDLTESEGGDTANIDLAIAASGADQRRHSCRQADRRRRRDGPSSGPGFDHRSTAGGAHRLLRGTAPGRRDCRRPIRCHESRRKTAVHDPRHVGQVPIHHGQRTGSGYRRTKADIHKGYLDMTSTPLFAFGHGLSYTTFQYSPLRLASETVDVNGELRLSLTVTNTGKRRGTEVVQLYAADTATGVTLPAQQLIGFARLDLEPGASKTVSFVVPMSLLAYTGISGELIMESGPVEMSAGSSSSDIRSSATFTVTGQTRAIRGEDRAFLSVATVGS